MWPGLLWGRSAEGAEAGGLLGLQLWGNAQLLGSAGLALELGPRLA